MVRDGTVYYDYNYRKWDHRLVALDDTPDVHDEDFGTRSVRSGFMPAVCLYKPVNAESFMVWDHPLDCCFVIWHVYLLVG